MLLSGQYENDRVTLQVKSGVSLFHSHQNCFQRYPKDQVKIRVLVPHFLDHVMTEAF